MEKQDKYNEIPPFHPSFGYATPEEIEFLRDSKSSSALELVRARIKERTKRARRLIASRELSKRKRELSKRNAVAK